jgi:hypothetical protein
MNVGTDGGRVAVLVCLAAILVGCEKHKSATEAMGLTAAMQKPATDEETTGDTGVGENTEPNGEGNEGETEGQPTSGTAHLRLTYNVTPNAEWQPGQSVILYADGRRNPELNQEDIFGAVKFPGTYPRVAGQQFDFNLPDVKVGETILVQGYMCSEGTSDCYPSDKDNPPSCAVPVKIEPNFKPSCQPVYTWTGGSGNGGVLCHATCTP